MTNLNELLKNTSRSLYLSAHYLPSTVRGTFSIAYLLCRYADSIADTSLLTNTQRLKWVEIFPTLITHPDSEKEQALLQNLTGSSSNIYEEKLLKNLPACLSAFNQLPEANQALVLNVVHAVCEGMKIDLKTFPPENAHQLFSFTHQAELENYCHLMGGEPGVFWSKLITGHLKKLSVNNEHFWQLGKDIGDALQIVNILRDLPRDLRIGRCYFPSEQLKQHGLNAQDLLEQINSPRFEPIKKYWINWGREKLRSAKAYFAALPRTSPRYRATMAWPVLWAADTLNKLEAETNLLDPAHRVKISRNRIYATLALTPPLFLSNTLFNKWLEYKLGPRP